MDDALLELQAKQLFDVLWPLIETVIEQRIDQRLSLDRCRPTWNYQDAASVATFPPPVYHVDVPEGIRITGVRIYAEAGTGAWDIQRSTDNGATWASIFSTLPSITSGKVGGANAVLHTHTGGLECAFGHLLKLSPIPSGPTGVTVQLLCEAKDGLRR